MIRYIGTTVAVIAALACATDASASDSEHTNESSSDSARTLTHKEAKSGAKYLAQTQANLLSTTDDPAKSYISGCNRRSRTSYTCRGIATGGGTKCILRAKLDTTASDREALFGFFLDLECSKTE